MTTKNVYIKSKAMIQPPYDYGEIFEAVKKHNLFFAGSFAHWLLKRDIKKTPVALPNDIDIFGFTSEEHLDIFCQELFKKRNWILAGNSNSFVYELRHSSYNENFLNIQLIDFSRYITSLNKYSIYDQPDTHIIRILDTIDFAQAAVAVWWHEEQWQAIFDENAFEKILHIRENLVNPVAALRRLGKYENKGYIVPKSAYIDLVGKYNQLEERVKKAIYYGENYRYANEEHDIYGNFGTLLSYWMKR